MSIVDLQYAHRMMSTCLQRFPLDSALFRRFDTTEGTRALLECAKAMHVIRSHLYDGQITAARHGIEHLQAAFAIIAPIMGRRADAAEEALQTQLARIYRVLQPGLPPGERSIQSGFLATAVTTFTDVAITK